MVHTYSGVGQTNQINIFGSLHAALGGINTTKHNLIAFVGTSIYPENANIPDLDNLFFLNCPIGQALVADCLPELCRQKETQLRHAFWGIYINKLSVNIAKPGLMYFYFLIDNI